MPNEDQPEWERRNSAVVSLTLAISKLSTGELATLRRSKLGKTGSGPFWWLYCKSGADQLAGKSDDWEKLMVAIAILTPSGQPDLRQSAHEPGTSLGQALYSISNSEHGAPPRDHQLLRLMSHSLPQRQNALLRLCRRLSNEKCRFDIRTLATLMLFEAKPDLRGLANDFYHAAYRDKQDQGAIQ